MDGAEPMGLNPNACDILGLLFSSKFKSERVASLRNALYINDLNKAFLLNGLRPVLGVLSTNLGRFLNKRS